MNILIVSHLFPTPDAPSYGIFVRRQAEALSGLSHEVRVISPTPYLPDAVARLTGRTPSSSLPEATSIGELPVKYVRHWSLPRPETLSVVSYLARHAISRRRSDFEWADVVNAHVAVPDGFASVRLAEEVGVPLVTTIHGADLQKSIDQPFVKGQIRRTVESSSETIVNSTKLRRLLNEEVTSTVDPQIVHNGVPLDLVPTTNPAVERADVFRLISVGDLVETKGQRYVLEAMARSDHPFEYIVVGSGPLEPELRHKSEELGIEDRVIFVGAVPHEEVFRHLKRADVFVLPSFVEAFGIAYIEAMACGLPVVACRGEGPEDYITHGKTGFLVPPKRVDPLVDVLEMLADCKENREHVARRGRQVARNQFSWERNAKIVEEIFERVQAATS